MELAELEADSSGAAASADSELASLLRQARASLQQLSSSLDKWELRMLLSGPYDEAGALLSITAGAGNEAPRLGPPFLFMQWSPTTPGRLLVTAASLGMPPPVRVVSSLAER